jgi:glutamine amidotransferase
MIAVVDYGAGNLRSVANALDHLGADYAVTGDAEGVARARKVIFPGVGAAGGCMSELATRGLDEAIRRHRGPVLGICLGMQVLTEWSEEGLGRVACLGVLPGHTARFRGVLKLPQIGWNTVRFRQEDPLFSEIPSDSHFYFAHSYRVHTDPVHVLGETEYGGEYPSVVRRDNFRGVQFHPEKSGPHGLRLLRNFVELC